MNTPEPDSLDRLSHSELIGLVRELLGEVKRLRAENEKLNGSLAKLKLEHQAVKDELARLKHLPPRPPQKPSGMDKSTDRGGIKGGGKGEKPVRRRGSTLDKLKINETVVLKAKAPVGSRHRGYDEIVVQDLVLNPKVTLYRRERWETPDGGTIVAELDLGIIGGYGPHLHRLVLMLHFQGQMTCERIVALLNGVGVVISKRQVVRLLTAKLATFQSEDAQVLNAGLSSAAYITVDDTSARHANKDGFTTQIGSDRFTIFRTGPAKSRLAFLSRLCGSVALYVINEAALDYMNGRGLSQSAIDKAGSDSHIFSSSEEWARHLDALGLTDLKVTPDPVLIASEGALWGAIRHQGLLQDTIIVSDDAGQFRIGEHALCWIHAERLVHKLVPANDKQRSAIEVAKRMIWWFYRSLKDYKLAPGHEQAQVLRDRFDRIFKRRRTGYAMLDRLLKRLFRRKEELLRVLSRPEIPLNTNASENDIRAFVTKRKISGGTVSDNGRDARDVMLGLAKTCMKLKISFYHFLGARLGVGPPIPHLATLICHAPP